MPKHKKYGPEEFSKMVDDWIEHARANKEPLLKESFAIWADLYDEFMEFYSRDPLYSRACQKLTHVCREYILRRVLHDRNPAGAIFLAKACYGYTETSGIQQHDINITVSWGADRQTSRLIKEHQQQALPRVTVSDDVAVTVDVEEPTVSVEDGLEPVYATADEPDPGEPHSA